MTSVNKADSYALEGPHLGWITPLPRIIFACFRACGAAALEDKPNRRRVRANKLSLYIFFESGWYCHVGRGGKYKYLAVRKRRRYAS